MDTLANIDFIYFDVGNVFICDDPAAVFIYRRLYETLGGERWGTPRDLFRQRLQHAQGGGQLWSFVQSCLPNGSFEAFRKETRRALYERWHTVSPEVPGMADAARALAGRYRLGLLANQPLQVEPLLKSRGLWDLFEVHGISAMLGMEKPDRRLFEWAIAQTGLAPQRILMVGDRIDNDIAPARAAGMRGLWLSLTFEQRAWVPEDEFGNAYLESARQHYPSNVRPASPEEQPDAVANSPEELVRLLT
jgi:HAD superfamily hydrolase (TIGR01549 family)